MHQLFIPGIRKESRALPLAFAALLIAGCGRTETGDRSGQPEDEVQSMASFVSPSDGDTVSSPFTVVMRADGIAIEPAGEIKENSGHFHILVDAPFVTTGQVVPTDSSHLHFGTGASEAELTLAPGTHTLRLQVANGAHIAYSPATHGDEITVTVQ